MRRIPATFACKHNRNCLSLQPVMLSSPAVPSGRIESGREEWLVEKATVRQHPDYLTGSKPGAGIAGAVIAGLGLIVCTALSNKNPSAKPQFAFGAGKVDE